MAAASYRKALELDANLKGAYLELGEILVAKGDHSAAVEVLQKATEKMPDSAPAFQLLGTAQEKQKQVDEALASFSKAAELDPKLAEAHYWRGKLLHEQKKDVAAALPSLEKAAELDPTDADIVTDYGVALYDGKQLDKAMTTLQKATAMPDYKNVKGMTYMGVLYREPGPNQNFPEAAKWFGKAAEALPNWGLPHWGLAWSLFGQIKKGCPCGPEDDERVTRIKEHAEKAASLGVNDPALMQRAEALAKGEKLK
jgi:superkiller protein 3